MSRESGSPWCAHRDFRRDWSRYVHVWNDENHLSVDIAKSPVPCAHCGASCVFETRQRRPYKVVVGELCRRTYQRRTWGRQDLRELLTRFICADWLTLCRTLFRPIRSERHRYITPFPYSCLICDSYVGVLYLTFSSIIRNSNSPIQPRPCRYRNWIRHRQWHVCSSRSSGDERYMIDDEITVLT